MHWPPQTTEAAQHLLKNKVKWTSVSNSNAWLQSFNTNEFHRHIPSIYYEHQRTWPLVGLTRSAQGEHSFLLGHHCSLAETTCHCFDQHSLENFLGMIKSIWWISLGRKMLVIARQPKAILLCCFFSLEGWIYSSPFCPDIVTRIIVCEKHRLPGCFPFPLGVFRMSLSEPKRNSRVLGRGLWHLLEMRRPSLQAEIYQYKKNAKVLVVASFSSSLQLYSLQPLHFFTSLSFFELFNILRLAGSCLL